MRLLSNSNGSYHCGETHFEDRSSRASNKTFILKANKIDLYEIFKHYNINIDHYTNKTKCPFLSHKNGQERTPSLYYYPDTNSFYCFGCQTGGSSVDFISSFLNISKNDAAIHILNIFDEYSSEIEIPENHNVFDHSIKFSNMIRNFLIKNNYETDAILYAENLCRAYDLILKKHSVKPEGLEVLHSNLKSKLEQYYVSKFNSG